jgi:hemerythrin-like domain-containing protein
MPRKASASSTAFDAISILIEDHHKIIRLFAEFRKIKDQADDNVKQILVELACTELVIHAQVEEEFLYPALRDALNETDLDLIDEAEVEHTLARQLISDLESMQPDDALYDAKFTVLGEYVKHHIEEEQNSIFPVIKLAGLDLACLGSDMLARREQLRSEFGISDEGHEEDLETEFFQPVFGKKEYYYHH